MSVGVVLPVANGSRRGAMAAGPFNESIRERQYIRYDNAGINKRLLEVERRWEQIILLTTVDSGPRQFISYQIQ